MQTQWVMSVLITLGFVTSPSVHAQELEPRAYSNAPVGLNFLIAGYGYTQGGVLTDPAIPLTNADIRIHTAVLAYARSVDMWGRSGKFDVVLPYASLSGTADVEGQPVERDISGMGDARLRLSINFLGAPALSLKEIASYRQDLIVGASLQVGIPIGQYDSTRLVNLGTHRWVVRPELGISKAAGRWTFELAGAAAIFGDNDDFFGGHTREQDPIYSVQGGFIYGFRSGVWMAVSGTYYTGGRTTVDGARGNDLQKNSRVGATLALPVNRHNSIKLYANSGVSTRTGSDFDSGGIAWQYRWGGGL
ncbi:MAG: transporter [Steroidobacteraceae bacterium]